MALSLGVALSASSAVFTILDENVDEVLGFITSGEGTPSKSNDAYRGSESLFVESTGGDGQNFNSNVPDWSFGVTENPVADSEFRYITFAWKKDGGDGLQLQLHGVPDTWGHRYHGGANVKNWNPSIPGAGHHSGVLDGAHSRPVRGLGRVHADRHRLLVVGWQRRLL